MDYSTLQNLPPQKNLQGDHIMGLLAILSQYFYFVTLPITLPFVCRVNGGLSLPVPDIHLPKDFFVSDIPQWKKVGKQFYNVWATE